MGNAELDQVIGTLDTLKQLVEKLKKELALCQDERVRNDKTAQALAEKSNVLNARAEELAKANAKFNDALLSFGEREAVVLRYENFERSVHAFEQAQALFEDKVRQINAELSNKRRELDALISETVAKKDALAEKEKELVELKAKYETALEHIKV